MLTHWLLKIRIDGLRRSPWRFGGLFVSVAGVLLALGPTVLKSLREIALSPDAGQTDARIASFFSYSLLAWMIAGGVFQFPLGWQIDVPRAMRLPVTPRQIYQSRLLYGLVGPWLLALLPAWLWLAWRQAASGPAFLFLLPAIALFATLCNQSAGILSLLRSRLTSGLPWMIALFCGFGLMNAVIFSAIRSAIGGDHEMLRRFGRLARALPHLPASLPLPGKIMARLYLAASAPSPGRMLVWLALLLLLVLAMAGVEAAMLRRVYWEARPFARTGPRGRTSWAAPAITALRGRPAAALFVKELQTLLENKSVRVLLFFFFSYLPLLVFFTPPPNYILAEVVCLLPVVVFSHIKGNLLGSEHPSRKIFFTQPGGVFAALRMKSRALNLLVGTLLGSALLPPLLAGRPAFSAFEWAMIALYAVALFYAWDMSGLYGSAFFPEPTDLRGVVQGNGNGLGGLAVFFGVQAVPAVFVPLQWGCARAGHRDLALPGGAAILLLLLTVHYRIFLPWLRAQLASRRETLYQQLAEPVL
ncbi:MAG: hypothetical protein SF339_13515 [Blastocatellia bacterium]|nr:hypothetical protein [Blastocatellia bacterium]